MKTKLTILTILSVALLGCAQQDLKKGLEANWMTDLNAALELAIEENKPVLLNFSGSDWCGWCIKLDREIFSQEEFVEYANENLILALADFPRYKPQDADQKQANEALARKYGVRGFPTVLILSPQGELLQQTGYQPGGTKAYVEMIKGIVAQ